MTWSIIIMAFVVVVVFALAAYVIVRFRRRPGDNSIPVQVEGSHKLEIIWTVIPIILLVILGVPTIQSVFGLAKDYSKDPDAIQVKVTAHQYWWEFEYPNHGGVKTAQELVIPNDAVISIEAKSNDVIHSFWIPSLAGKIDTNRDGNVNRMFFEAPKEGVYLGKCAELCGPSHSLMDFKVKVVDRASFDRWVAAQQAPVALPEDKATADLLQSQCLTCHAISGEDAKNKVFPNLTGIGSRETVAGMLVNTEDKKYENEGTAEENLKRWIKNSDEIKPGNKMPSFKDELSDEQIDALAKYLAGLKLEY